MSRERNTEAILPAGDGGHLCPEGRRHGSLGGHVLWPSFESFPESFDICLSGRGAQESDGSRVILSGHVSKCRVFPDERSGISQEMSAGRKELH